MPLWRRKSKEEEPPPLEEAPPFPEFAYHADPIKTGSIAQSSLPCSLCGHAYGFVYTGPVFASDDFVESPLCPWCIADGSAALRLRIEFTDVGVDVPDDVPGRVLDEIAERTPGFNGWQQEHWLYHCGDGAVFVGTSEAAGETAYRFKCRHCGTGLAYTDSP